jgi:hypothetical protein
MTKGWSQDKTKPRIHWGGERWFVQARCGTDGELLRKAMVWAWADYLAYKQTPACPAARWAELPG